MMHSTSEPPNCRWAPVHTHHGLLIARWRHKLHTIDQPHASLNALLVGGNALIFPCTRPDRPCDVYLCTGLPYPLTVSTSTFTAAVAGAIEYFSSRLYNKTYLIIIHSSKRTLYLEIVVHFTFVLRCIFCLLRRLSRIRLCIRTF